MKPAVARIEGKRVSLRPIEESDLENTLRWRNREDTRIWFNYSDKIEPEKHAEWFESYRKKADDFIFIIELREGGAPIGQVSIYNIDLEARRAEYGRVMIGEASKRGKGFAAEATRLIVDWAFERFGLNEIYLEVFKNNTTAIKMYEKIGFLWVRETDKHLYMSLKRGVREGEG